MKYGLFMRLTFKTVEPGQQFVVQAKLEHYTHFLLVDEWNVGCAPPIPLSPSLSFSRSSSVGMLSESLLTCSCHVMMLTWWCSSSGCTICIRLDNGHTWIWASICALLSWRSSSGGSESDPPLPSQLQQSLQLGSCNNLQQKLCYTL